MNFLRFSSKTSSTLRSANMANKTFKYLILGNEKELDIKSLEKIAPIRRVTTEEIFGY